MADDKQPDNLPVPSRPQSRLGELMTTSVSLQSLSGGMTRYARKRAGHFLGKAGPMSSGPLAKLAQLWRSKNAPRYLYRTDGTPIMGSTALNLLKTAKKDKWDLTALDARNQYLHEADFEGMTANEADFSDALCTGINFRDSRLKGANFRRAWLNGSNFRNADLRGADFTGAKIGNACLVPKWQLAIIGGFACSILFTSEVIDAVSRDLKKQNSVFRRKPDFTGANLDGAKFPVGLDFQKLGLSAQQIKQIVLVDKHGTEISDVRIGPDGSLIFPGKPAAAALPAPDQTKAP